MSEETEEETFNEDSDVNEYYERGSFNITPYVENEVIAVVEDEETAQALADEYNLTLKEYSNGVATYDTGDQSPTEVVENSNGQFELNYIYEIVPVEPNLEKLEKIYEEGGFDYTNP